MTENKMCRLFYSQSEHFESFQINVAFFFKNTQIFSQLNSKFIVYQKHFEKIFGGTKFKNC